MPLASLLFLFLLIFPGAQLSNAVPSKRDPEAYLLRASSSFQSGNMDDALVQAEIAKEIKPDLPGPYLLTAQIYEKQEKKDRAADDLLECVQKCSPVPEKVLEKLFELTTQNMVFVVSPHGKKSVVGAKGITDVKKREKIVSAFRNRPELYLLFAERFVRGGNITDTFTLLSGFNCPPRSRWLYQSIRARGFYLFGKRKELEEAVAELLKEPSSDYVRLYELAKVCLNSSLDEEAEKFLLAARKSLNPKDEEYARKIDLALKSPNVLLDDDNHN